MSPTYPRLLTPTSAKRARLANEPLKPVEAIFARLSKACNKDREATAQPAPSPCAKSQLERDTGNQALDIAADGRRVAGAGAAYDRRGASARSVRDLEARSMGSWSGDKRDLKVPQHYSG